MAGFSYYKDVDNYATLAAYYDELLQDEESLENWYQYISEYVKGKDVLELASGSGVMAKILKERGYNVIASDLSKDMKEAAKQNFDGEYLIMNMIDFQLDQKFDLILCICDSMNYLASEEEMNKMFGNVYHHLKDDGVFIFDMHHKARIDEFEDEYIEEGFVHDIPYQWTIQSDRVTNNLYEHFVFYEEDGIIQEHHVQHVFDDNATKTLLEANNFNVTLIKDFIEDEKVLLIGEKK